MTKPNVVAGIDVAKHALDVHVFDWGEKGALTVRGIPGTIKGVRALDKKIGFPGYSSTLGRGGSVLNLSRPARPDPIATGFAVKLQRTGK